MNLKLNKDNYQLAVDWITSSKHIVVFTGAGISVESGIPPFRGENGLWTKYDPVFLDITYFKAKPKKSWTLIKEIFYEFFGCAKPNDAHLILAKWENQGIINTIITQNIDNLHQESGSKHVIEFHGTAQTLTCLLCQHKFGAFKFLNNLPPSCPNCGGLLKPDFVFFTDPIPHHEYAQSLKHAEMADLFIIVGTTGEIMPASMIPYIAQEKGDTKFIEVNTNSSNYTATLTNIFLKGRATAVFQKLDKLITQRFDKC